MSKDMSKEWDYRVVRQTTEDGAEWLSVQEVYYDDETGKPMAHTMDLEVIGDSIADLRKTLQRMLWCLDKEIVDEIESDVSEHSMENRVLSLEMENAEMRGKLTELSNEISNKEKNLTNKLPAGLSGEEIDGMYTDDEMEEWGTLNLNKDGEKRGL